jgi:polysaccharide pyruvyl transferase WcaK-like protein
MHEANRDLLRDVLGSFAAICVRDARSYELAAGLGPEVAERVLLSRDPAILLGDIGLAPPEDGEVAGGPPTLLVSPCPYHTVVGNDPDNRDGECLARLGDALSLVCSQSACDVKLLVMNGDARIGDLSFCRRLEEMLPRGRAEVIDYHPDPMHAFTTIRRAALVIGMRLHSVILSYAAEVPFVALSYHSKVRDFADDVGVEAGQVYDPYDFQPQELADTVVTILKGKAADHLPRVAASQARADVLQAFESFCARLRDDK